MLLNKRKAYLALKKEGVFIGQAKETTSIQISIDIKVVSLVPDQRPTLCRCTTFKYNCIVLSATCVVQVDYTFTAYSVLMDYSFCRSINCERVAPSVVHVVQDGLYPLRKSIFSPLVVLLWRSLPGGDRFLLSCLGMERLFYPCGRSVFEWREEGKPLGAP